MSRARGADAFRYKKEMGQHFIFDPALIEALAEASGVTRDDGVLEIGPGRGTLTAALARRARKVIAVELDRTLISGLHASMALYPNVEIVQGDILRQDLALLAERLGAPCRVAANLPYNITTPAVERLLTGGLPFLSLAVMVQKEAGERMLAGPGEPGYGPLSILVDLYAHAREMLEIPASSFTPPPKVDSAFLLMTLRDAPRLCLDRPERLLRLVRVAFAQRRKTLLNNLVGGLALPRDQAAQAIARCGLPPDVRAERVPLEAFARLLEEVEG